jgi:hypothetical protein
MAQVSLYQYAEIVKSDGSVERIGSKNLPSTITLTGTGEIFHVVKNDLDADPAVAIYNGELTGIKWWAIKSSVAAQVSFGTDATASNSQKLIAGQWQFFGSGYTTNSSSTTLATRAAAADAYIADISIYAATAADVELVIAY